MTAYNALTGPVPNEIGNMSALRGLYLCESAFISRVKKDSHPVRLSHTFLVLLEHSRMTDNNALTGSIPKKIGNISALSSLYLGEWAFMSRVKK
jgi:hypothetical protein